MDEITDGDRVDEIGGQGRTNGFVMGVSRRGVAKVSWPTAPGETPYIETHDTRELRRALRTPPQPDGPAANERGSA